jgi:small subunit ribosomal protein S3
MGHKVHPVGFRVGVIRGWDAKWYADKHYVNYLLEDLKVRRQIRSMYPEAGVSQVEVDRQANNVTLTIHTARPGILIGRGGQRVDEMRTKLERLIDKRIQLNIREVQQPELDAFLVARSVADQMERRVGYRRAMKQTLTRTMQAGARGMRIRCAGRLDGAEIARKITMHEGRVPLHTIRADIDYGFTEARTVMGRIGVKVWIYKGEIFPEKEEEMPAAPAAAAAVEEAKPETEQAQPVAAVAPPAVVEKPAEQPAPAAEEKPRPVRRVARPRVAEAPPAEAPAAAPAAEEKPKAPARRVTRPRAAAPAAAAPAAAPSAEEKPKTAPRRLPRTTKPKEVKAEETPAESTGDKGEGNAST